AVESITRGLTLDPEEPHKAYFNRALAYEAMGNVRAAYADYRRAQELSPSWDAPQRELARYTVTQR
ncbi:MAG: tetratricopeptide repeat protein, partial [Hyphomonadaceae bacterium]